VSFEQGFAEVERSANAVLKAASLLSAAVKALAKAAQEGDLGKIAKQTQRMDDAAALVRQEVANAREAWPFNSETEQQFLLQNYTAELLAAARASGLRIEQRDNTLAAYPSIVRVLAAERAIRINKSKITALRPSRLIERLKAAQNQKPKATVQPFLESLFSAYRLISKDHAGATVPLAQIYRVLTMLPGASSDYTRDDFSRDLLTLDRSGIDQTRSGALVSLPASTGTKNSRDVFACAAPNGEVVTYYGIAFAEATHESGDES
jgi:hypothetical protein